MQSVFSTVAQVVDAYLTAGDLSTFIIYALYVGGNVGALAGVISNLIQASLPQGFFRVLGLGF